MDKLLCHLSVVIPAYNESRRIIPTLEKINDFLSQQNYPFEVLIVDDTSTDNTRDVVSTFIADKPSFQLLLNSLSKGKGAAIKNGILKAKGDYVLFSDADLSTPIEEVEKMLVLMSTYDVVIGSRRLKGCHLLQRQPFYREFSGRVFSVLVRFFTVRGFLDTQCGFKLFKREPAQRLFSKMTIDGFGFDVEILYLAVKKFKLGVKELPVTWKDSPATTVRLIHDSLNMFVDLLRIRLNDWKGKYG